MITVDDLGHAICIPEGERAILYERLCEKERERVRYGESGEIRRDWSRNSCDELWVFFLNAR